MISTKKSIYFIFLITVASTTLYVVFKNLPPLIGSFRFFWAPITLIIILFIKPQVLFTKPFIWIIFYGILMIGILQPTLWQYMTESTKPGIYEEFYNLSIFTAIFSYLYFNRDYATWARLSKMGFFFILITIVGTNIALTIDPLLVRNSASTLTSFQNNLARYTGSGGYGYAQAFVLLIPILFYHIKYRNQLIFKRGILIIIMISIFITLVRAQVFANILVAIAMSLFSIFGAKRAKQSFVIITLITIILISIPSSIYANLLSSAGSYFESSSTIHQKLIDFAHFIRNPEFTDDTQAGSRAERYPMLFKAFLASPIFGNASYDSPFYTTPGFHLYWMNRLTQWGIVGFLFFIYMLFQIYKRIRSIFDDSFRFYYFLAVSGFIMLGLMKNIAGREPFLMLIIVIPGFYFLPTSKTKYPKKVNKLVQL